MRLGDWGDILHLCEQAVQTEGDKGRVSYLKKPLTCLLMIFAVVK